MGKILSLLILAILIFVMIAARRDNEKPAYVEGEVIVKFKQGVTAEATRDILAPFAARTVKQFEGINVNVYKLPEGKKIKDVIKEIRNQVNIEYVEPNYIVHTFNFPNDPDFSKCWGLHNTGQTGGKNNADINAPEAWDSNTGSDSVIVGVIDTGIDISHPDLAANIFTNPGEDAWRNPDNPSTGNGIDDDNNGKIDDWKGWNFITEKNDARDDNKHGTHVAGTIGAIGNNGIGIAGVNWHVRLMPLKFLSAAGSGTTSDAIEAIIYAADMGAKILNNSWGGGGESRALEDAIKYADSKGVLFVVAAGNDGTNNDLNPTYPACYEVPNILAVAASDHNDDRALWGSAGGIGNCGIDCGGNGNGNPPGSNYGAKSVDLAAPGKDIFSTAPGGYEVLSGTSMATPHVTGLAALVLAKFPTMNHLEIKQKLMDTVDKLPPLANKVVSGGRINSQKALSIP